MAKFQPNHGKFPQPVDTERHFLSLALRAQEEEEELTGLLVKDLTLNEEDLTALVLRDVVFDHCRFPGCNWSGSDFADVAFHTCDLSGGNFDNSYWLRFAWEESKAMALRLQNCRMYQGTLCQSRLSFANFDHGKLKDVRFSGGELDGTFFTQCAFTGVEFQECNLTLASFVHTSLKNVDVSSCRIDGLSLSENCSELRGAIVDTHQAAELAKRLGLIIKS